MNKNTLYRIVFMHFSYFLVTPVTDLRLHRLCSPLRRKQRTGRCHYFTVTREGMNTLSQASTLAGQWSEKSEKGLDVVESILFSLQIIKGKCPCNILDMLLYTYSCHRNPWRNNPNQETEVKHYTTKGFNRGPRMNWTSPTGTISTNGIGGALDHIHRV